MTSIQSGSYLDSIDPLPAQDTSEHPPPQQPAILLPRSPCSSPQESRQSPKVSHLFTARSSHSKAPEPPIERHRVDSSHAQKPPNSAISGAHISLHMAKLANQWLVVWRVDCEMGNLQNAIQAAGCLSLSTVITYHSAHSPVFDPPRPSILPTPLLSDSPPNLDPRPSSPRVGDSGFENAIEIDLFDGMGRDISVSLTRPVMIPSSSGSAYQIESTHKPQSKRQGPPSNRYSHSRANPKIALGLANPSRSEDYLPTFPEERSQSAPAPSIPIVRRAFTSVDHKESPPIRPALQETEPTPPDLPFLEQNLTSVIPIVDPLILRVDTIAPQHRLKSRELTNEQLNHPEIRFVEMEKVFIPMLMLELCYEGGATGASDEEFLIESLDIKLEEQGLLPEFDNFVTSTIKIMPIHPTQPPGDNAPYRISRDEVHSLIYIVRIEPADVLSEQGQHRDSSFLQYGCPPVNISLPPSTLISSVRSAFTPQKTGIIVEEAHKFPEDENISSATAADRAENTPGSSSTGGGSGKPRGLDGLLEAEARCSGQAGLARPAGAVYLLSITIHGKIASKDSRMESTGPISASWTSLLSAHDLSDSTTLDLRRQMNHDNLGPWSGDEPADKIVVPDIVLPGVYEDDQLSNGSVFPHGGLVAGSKRHTASNLINALQELSAFQGRTYTADRPLILDRSRTQKKQLSPLALGHDPGFLQQRAHADDSSRCDPPASASPPVINTGRRFVPDTRQRTPTSTGSHSSPQVPERAHQPAEVDHNHPGAEYPGGCKTSKARRPTQTSTPASTGSSFARQIQTGPRGASDDGRGGEILVTVNVARGTNRVNVLCEFAVDIVVFNRSSSATLTEGPFKVKVLTTNSLLWPHHLALGSPEDACHDGPDAGVAGAAGAGGGDVVSLDDDIQVGPLGSGECEAVKIRLIGLKPGLVQLHGIHFVSLHNPPPPVSHHQSQQQQQQLPQFVLVDPLVVLIE